MIFRKKIKPLNFLLRYTVQQRLKSLRNYLHFFSKSRNVESFSENKKIEFFPYTAVEANALFNYRQIDVRLLWGRYLLSPNILASFSWGQNFTILIQLCFRLTILLLFMLCIFSLSVYVFIEPSLFVVSELSSIIVWLEDLSMRWYLSWFKGLCLFWDFCYSKLASISYFVWVDWLPYIDGGYEKLGGHFFLFEVFHNVTAVYTNLVCLFVAVLLFLQAFVFACGLFTKTRWSDNWNLMTGLTQLIDWDNMFLRTETIAQSVDIDLTATRLNNSYLHNFIYYYKLGFIDNELRYFNTLESLLRTSRSTFFGYRGFLNLFPTSSIVLDFERFIKKRILSAAVQWVKIRRRWAKRKLPLWKLSPHIVSMKGSFSTIFSFLPRSFFKANPVRSRSEWVNFIWSKVFSLRDSMTTYDDYRLIKTVKKFFPSSDWDWRLAMVDDEEELDNIIDPKTPFFSEENALSWYARELELFSTSNLLSLAPLKRTRNFNYGFKNFLGDFTFLRKQTNYHSFFDSLYPDLRAPYFEMEDDFEEDTYQSSFDTIPELDVIEYEEPTEFDDEVEEEEDQDDFLLFEDSFLYNEDEFLSLYNDEDYDELMDEEEFVLLSKKGQRISAEALKFEEFDIEGDEMREDIFDIFSVVVNMQRGDYKYFTTSSSYQGDTEIDFSSPWNYKHRIFDSIYDDLADFFWLNTNKKEFWRGVATIRGRFFYSFSNQRRDRATLYSWRSQIGRLAYAAPSVMFSTFFPRFTFLHIGWFFFFFLCVLFIGVALLSCLPILTFVKIKYAWVLYTLLSFLLTLLFALFFHAVLAVWFSFNLLKYVFPFWQSLRIVNVLWSLTLLKNWKRRRIGPRSFSSDMVFFQKIIQRPLISLSNLAFFRNQLLHLKITPFMVIPELGIKTTTYYDVSLSQSNFIHHNVKFLNFSVCGLLITQVNSVKQLHYNFISFTVGRVFVGHKINSFSTVGWYLSRGYVDKFFISQDALNGWVFPRGFNVSSVRWPINLYTRFYYPLSRPARFRVEDIESNKNAFKLKVSNPSMFSYNQFQEERSTRGAQVSCLYMEPPLFTGHTEAFTAHNLPALSLFSNMSLLDRIYTKQTGQHYLGYFDSEQMFYANLNGFKAYVPENNTRFFVKQFDYPWF